MAGLKNTFSGFLIFGIFVALFIGLLTILARILVYGLIIGLILYVLFWLKAKLFGKTNPIDKFNNNSQYTNDSFSCHNNQTNTYTKTKEGSKGRIIDVDPE